MRVWLGLALAWFVTLSTRAQDAPPFTLTPRQQALPRSHAADNELTMDVLIELPQRGPASASVSVSGSGAVAIPLRASFLRDDEQLRGQYEDIARQLGAKRMFVEVSKNRARDNSITLYTDDARNFVVGDRGGTLQVSAAQVFSLLPQEWLRSWWDTSKPAPLPKPYYVAAPHRTTLRYGAHLADGFSWRSLPASLSMEGDGVRVRRVVTSKNPREVELTFQLDLDARPLSEPALKRVEAMLRRFEQEAEAHLQFVLDAEQLFDEHRLRAGLAAHRALVARHPHDAVVVSRYARALGRIGLVHEAGRVAEQLSKQQPRSAHAQWTLAEVLLLDELGRPSYYPPADPARAERAYREALALDPHDSSHASGFLELSLHLTRGTRDPKRVNELAALYEQLWREDGSGAVGQLLAKLYLLRGSYRLAIELCEKLDRSSRLDAIMVAAVAAERGARPALDKAERLAGGIADRLLTTAISELAEARLYEPAAALASLLSVPEAAAKTAAVFQAAQQHDACVVRLAPVAQALQRHFGQALHEVWPVMSGEAYVRWTRSTLSIAEPIAASLQGLLLGWDTLSTMPLARRVEVIEAALPCSYDWHVEETAGALRVTVGPRGEPTRSTAGVFWLRRVKGGYAIVGARRELPTFAVGLHSALDDRKLDEARAWLAWARKAYDEQRETRAQGDERDDLEPLWPKADATEQELNRVAALLDFERADARTLAVLEEAIAQLAHEPAKANLVRWRHALALWRDPSRGADELAALRTAFRDEELTWQTQLSALGQARRYDDLARELTAFEARYPDSAICARMWLDTAQGRYAVVLARARERLAQHRSAPCEADAAALLALFEPGDLPAAVQLADAACGPRDKASLECLRTLASLQIASGEVDEGRATLEGYLGRVDDVVVTASEKMVSALFAEQLGDTEGARALYRQLSVGKAYIPLSCKDFAQRRLLALETTR